MAGPGLDGRGHLSAEDVRNGTITFDYFGDRYTFPGAFPDNFKVYFKDHNYTPDKDNDPVGYTWHWDNILIM